MRSFAIVVVLAACGSKQEPRSSPRDASIARIAPADAAVVAVVPPIDAAPVPPDADETPIRIAAVGDLMLGSLYPDTSGGRLPPDDGAALLTDATPILSAADLAFGNLEGAMYDGDGTYVCTASAIFEKHHGHRGSDCYSFRMPERYAAHLRDAGFDVLSLANNHIDDFGSPGRASTIAALDALGLAWSGPIDTVAHLTVHGHTVDVIAFSTYPGLNDMSDLDHVRALISASTAEIVIASFHGGAEGLDHVHVKDAEETYARESRGNPVAFGHAAVDAGADLVLGHGPHVLRALELRDGKLIAYSLGTFASYHGIGITGELGDTLVLDVSLAPDGRLVSGQIHAFHQSAPGGPHPDPDGHAIALLQARSKADFASTAPTITDDGAIAP